MDTPKPQPESLRPRRVALRGARDMFPILLGGVPFGLIAGVSASQVDLGPLEATGVSALIFAGASQLATYELLGKNAPAVIVLTTAVLINLRFALYSAAIAPILRKASRPKRLLYAYLLTDQAYALSAARRLKTPDAAHPEAYYLGSAVTLWLMWVVTTFVGAFVGAAIPPAWSLDFAVPLCFVALLAPAIKDRAQLVCAGITAGAALLLMNAPYNSGVILSALCGIVGGGLVDRWRRA